MDEQKKTLPQKTKMAILIGLATILVVAVVLVLIFVVFKHKHVFGSWNTRISATCTVEGVEERYCECGERQTRAIPIVSHNYKSATCTLPKTCIDCEGTSGEPLGHSYDPATCTLPKICSTCSSTLGEPLGHSYTAATCTLPKTCVTCSATEGNALGHSYVGATCTTPQTCSVCNYTDGKASGHSYVAATCTAPKTCKICRKTEGGALGHSYSEATCTSPETCRRCGSTRGQALDHTISATTSTCIDCGTFGYSIEAAVRAATQSTLDWINYYTNIDDYEIYNVYYILEDDCKCSYCLDGEFCGESFVTVVVFFEYTIGDYTGTDINVVGGHKYYEYRESMPYWLGAYTQDATYYYRSKDLVEIFAKDYSYYYDEDDLILISKNIVL